MDENDCLAPAATPAQRVKFQQDFGKQCSTASYSLGAIAAACIDHICKSAHTTHLATKIRPLLWKRGICNYGFTDLRP